MFISILYSAVIIGLGTSQLIDMQAAKAEADFKTKEDARIDEEQRQAMLSDSSAYEEGADQQLIDETDVEANVFEQSTSSATDADPTGRYAELTAEMHDHDDPYPEV